MSLISQLIVGAVLIAIVLDFMFGWLVAVIYTMVVSALFVLVIFLDDYWLVALVLGIILVLLAKPVFAKRLARLVLMVERLSHGHQLPKNGLRFGLVFL